MSSCTSTLTLTRGTSKVLAITEHGFISESRPSLSVSWTYGSPERTLPYDKSIKFRNPYIEPENYPLFRLFPLLAPTLLQKSTQTKFNSDGGRGLGCPSVLSDNRSLYYPSPPFSYT